MPTASGQKRGKLPPKQAPLRLSKAAACCLVVTGLLVNCRSPHNLDAGADRSGEPPLGIPWLGGLFPSGSLAGLHLSWGLASIALFVCSLATWYLASPASPARHPWTALEALTAVGSLSGAALRLWCYRELGRLFTFEVGIRQGHSLVQTGPYALLVHPAYLGAALLAWTSFFLAGPGMVMRRPAVVVGLLDFGISCLALRIAYEERMLEEHFGEAWRAHVAARWRIVPFVF